MLTGPFPLVSSFGFGEVTALMFEDWAFDELGLDCFELVFASVLGSLTWTLQPESR